MHEHKNEIPRWVLAAIERMEGSVTEKQSLPYPDHSDFMVVSNLDDQHTRPVGWDLLALLPEQDELVTKVYDSYRGDVNLDEPKKVTRTHFLLGKPKAGVVRELLNLLDSANDYNCEQRNKLWEIERERDKANKIIEEQKKMIDDKNAEITRADSRADNYLADVRQLGADNAQLRADLKKITKHFGEAAIKELLGEKEK